MCDGLKFESEQGGDPVLQPLLRFLEVWNPTLHALELGSATGLTRGRSYRRSLHPTTIQSVGGTPRTPSAARHVVTPLWRTGQLLDCRQLFPNPIPEEYPVVRPNRRQMLIAFSIPPNSVQFKGEINDALPRKRHQKRHLEFCTA